MRQGQETILGRMEAEEDFKQTKALFARAIKALIMSNKARQTSSKGIKGTKPPSNRQSKMFRKAPSNTSNLLNKETNNNTSKEKYKCLCLLARWAANIQSHGDHCLGVITSRV